MTSLSAGDYVLTQAADGALAHTRVILNQHKVARDSDASSPLLTLYHDRGTLSLSPDHVLRVGGEFGAQALHYIGGALPCCLPS